jgi:hypothetical protein
MIMDDDECGDLRAILFKTSYFLSSYSPSWHSAFHDAESLIRFVDRLRHLSGGKPVGIKLCVGDPVEFAQIVHASIRTGIYLDFITVDGGEGGTGAAPPEYRFVRRGLSDVHTLSFCAVTTWGPPCRKDCIWCIIC